MKRTRFFFIVLLAGLLLAGCAGFNFSPEAAAISAVQSSVELNFSMDSGSIQVHQTLDLSDQFKVVMITFSGTRKESRPQSCIYAYRVEKANGFWRPSSGGGGCQTNNPPIDQQEALTIGAGQSGSSRPGDPGFSQVYGMVYEPTIVKVRVTWNDDQADEVEVINSSYVASRLGMVDLKFIEGLDEQGKVVYGFKTPDPAPGKQ